MSLLAGVMDRRSFIKLTAVSGTTAAGVAAAAESARSAQDARAASAPEPKEWTATPSRHVGHLLDGECTLEELMLPAPRGLRVVPAGSGARRLAQLDNGEHAAIIRAFDELAQPPEYLLVDTAAGLSDNVTMFAAAAAEVIVVVCDEPASLTDAYGLTKVLSRDFGVRRVRMVANMVRNEGDARAHQPVEQ